jgi:AraC family transcriptional regulator, regulatory protein of adaptative response / methylated-DNA-[protein]-cysteine methyltransferase
MQLERRRAADAIAFLEQNLLRQPSLTEVADVLGVSPYHFQRSFRRMTGVSPKRFLQFLTLESAKPLLEEAHSVLDTAFALGLSGSARLYDHFVSLEGVTPGEFKARGDGLALRWGVHPSVFGRVFIATTPRGICQLAFCASANAAAEREDLHQSWPRATLIEDPDATRDCAEALFERTPPRAFHLHLPGSNLQIQVWKALLRIAPGSLCSYQQLARACGAPASWRAVGNAVARNPVAVLIPCHRVIRKTGDFGAYRWGSPRKRALIAWEQARSAAPRPGAPMPR